MIEACVAVRYQGERGAKRKGDILVVKLPGAPWGTEQLRCYQIIELDDPALETELLRRDQSTAGVACISYPYAEYDAGGEVVARSRVRLDVDALTAQQRADILDHELATPTLRSGTYQLIDER